MSYSVKGTDVDALYGWVAGYRNEVSSQLSMVGGAVGALASLQGFQGEAADAVKAYWTEVHGTLLLGLAAAMEEAAARCSAYMQPYFSDIDTDRGCCFRQEPIVQAAGSFASSRSDLEGKDRALRQALGPVSDLVPTWTPPLFAADSALFDAAEKARTLDARVSQHEAYHAAEAGSLGAVISALKAQIASRGASAAGGVGYVPQSCFGDPAFAGYAAAVDASMAYSEALAGYVSVGEAAFADRAYARWEEEELRRLEEEGRMQFLAGAVTFVVGAVVCVATLGAATPVFVATAAAFTASAAFQLSEMYEGADKVRLAREGDLSAEAFNPMRDVVFGGNQELYDVGCGVTTALVGLAAPAGLAFGAVRSGGAGAARQVALQWGKGFAADTALGIGTDAAGDAVGRALFGGNEAAVGYFKGAAGGLTGLTGIKGGRDAAAAAPAGPCLDSSDFRLKGLNSVPSRNTSIKPILNGPYIKNGKPNGRPQLYGDKKLQFERAVYEMNVGPDGVLRDPNTGEVIDWIPGDPRKGVVDFGHKSGNSYGRMFEKYRNNEIFLKELKEFQFDPDNYRLETPAANRGRRFE